MFWISALHRFSQRHWPLLAPSRYLAGPTDIRTQIWDTPTTRDRRTLQVKRKTSCRKSRRTCCIWSGVYLTDYSSTGRRVARSTIDQDDICTDFESETYRARRILPQLPSSSTHIQPDSYSTFHDASEDGVQRELPQTEDREKLYVQADLDPDSLSDASRSDDGSVIEQRRKSENARSEVNTVSKDLSSACYDDSPEADRASTTKFSTSTITRQYGRHKLGRTNVSSDREDSGGVESSSLMRQESYTKPRASDDTHYMKLPNISSAAFESVVNQDTQSYLRETENALASLESKLHDQTSRPREDSGDSDVDTSSTVSQPSGKNDSKKSTVHSDVQKEKRSAGPCAQAPNALRSSSGDPGRSYQPRQVLLDSEPPTSRTSHWSDQESRPVQRKYIIPLQKDTSSRTNKNSVSQALARSNSLSAPKPTRTSMLRRARLGDASDNDGAETDRTSQNSDGNQPSNRQQETKGLSRLDRLALPRRRTGSFTTPSDTESSAGRAGYSNRSNAESAFPLRKSSVAEIKPGVQKPPGTTGRQPIIRGRSSSAKYTSSTASEFPFLYIWQAIDFLDNVLSLLCVLLNSLT